jgi:hypothetical protein
MHLAAYPFAVVNVACIYCNRKGRYRLATLIEKHGPATTLECLAKRMASDCGAALERTGKFGCNGVYFPDLEVPRRAACRDEE